MILLFLLIHITTRPIFQALLDLLKSNALSAALNANPSPSSPVYGSTTIIDAPTRMASSGFPFFTGFRGLFSFPISAGYDGGIVPTVSIAPNETMTSWSFPTVCLSVYFHLQA